MKSIIKIACLLLCCPLAVIAESTQIHYLSGTGSDDTVEWEFYCTKGRNSGQWTTIPVPSNWELQGFGVYNYGHDKDKSDEIGRYRYRFDVPAKWRGKHAELVFGGVMTDTEARINGTVVGSKHRGGFYEFSYDVTELLQYGGENVLEVEVSKVSSDPSVEAAERKADYWVFGGIYRPVWLKVSPLEHIERVAIDARADGRFRVECFVRNATSDVRVSVQIRDAEGQPVGPSFETLLAEGESKAILESKLGHCRTWSAETPYTYTVELSLIRDNRTVHTYRERFGFRTVEVRPQDGIYINGRKVLLKGVNRHTFWPESGRTTSKALSIVDVQLMKDMNMNAVRMSHYPPDRHFLDVCDSLGLYVLDELAGWQRPAYDTEVGRKLVREMVVRDVNHPSILFWDNGNEGGNNPDLVPEFDVWDPQHRTVLQPWDFFGGMETALYRPYDVAKRILSREIYMPTEALHGLYDGGHGGGLEDYWRLISESPRGGGMFLWVFADEGVVRTDRNGELDVDGNHAPDGILGPHREKEGSYYAIKDIWSPIQLTLDGAAAAGFDGRIRVQNLHDFTALDQCTFEWRLLDFPVPASGHSGHRVTTSGSVHSPDIPPQTSGTIQLLDLPETMLESDALSLTAWAPDGRLIRTWSTLLQTPASFVESIVQRGNGPVIASEDQNRVTVTAGRLTIAFSRRSGTIASVRWDEQTRPISRGPRNVSGRGRADSVEHYPEGEDYVIDVKYGSANMESLRWRIHPTGWVKMSYQYYLEGTVDYHGLTFSLPDTTVRGMRWLGEGPARVWKNRMRGLGWDVWERPYKDNVPGRSWDYPHFKGYYANFRWAVIETTDGPITIATDTPNLFLRVGTPKLAGDNLDRNTAVPFPRGGVSFLHAIPAVGTKFQRAERLGPQGARPVAEGLYRGTLYFYFGE